MLITLQIGVYLDVPPTPTTTLIIISVYTTVQILMISQTQNHDHVLLVVQIQQMVILMVIRPLADVCIHALCYILLMIPPISVFEFAPPCHTATTPLDNAYQVALLIKAYLLTRILICALTLAPMGFSVVILLKNVCVPVMQTIGVTLLTLYAPKNVPILFIVSARTPLELV